MSYLRVRLYADNKTNQFIANELHLLNALGAEEHEDGSTLYFDQSDSSKHDIETVLNQLLNQLAFRYEIAIEPETNWNQVWEASYQPMTIGHFCHIRASFHPKNTDVAHDVVINPRMSFGTGHHETTTLMIEALQHTDLKRKDVLDLGCGTGILAILASKCGANQVTAVDIDENAIDNAKENCQLNNAAKVQCIQGTITSVDEAFDLIFANINRNMLLQEAKQIADTLTPNGTLILSGFYSEDVASIMNTYNQQGVVVETEFKKNNWTCVIFKKLVR